ncbi:putative CH-like domain in sperm protein [Monocercomonoides exilis]|uniref:putative CH-like domain in sperm protein n=1 Tax=Monocercomonoides exilis TaxID=2049356 RepID=UPI00355A0F1A|nr:putative CH-like domain in sperm protein [Monocercomonoides exilis]|eukprot:MONOS_11572.1-p1 / transcript=MONOS_11572.1 / gene=MONOS_11572 / organism=Monocercomonoides_exilis_PA203 / gene_product=spermatogenesis-associated protein 4 / transcript_product=spermatogenesis-associated protein 4 / location=Mono_scaffold00588:1730-5831(+) / protein_length=865 / sequence_SO=supercontig / SO=protein_coding / is_pseudo=false
MALLGREMIKWIQSLDISVIIKNPKRDFANGYVVGEIFSCYFPNEVTKHSFDPGSSSSARTQNWDFLNTFFRKFNVPITPKMIDDTMNYRTEGTQQLIDTMYTFLTRRSVPPRPVISPLSQVPGYAQPTTSLLVKEHEQTMKKQDTVVLTREAEDILSQHHEMRIQEKEKNPKRFEITHKKEKGAPRQMKPKTDTTNIGFKGVEIRPLGKKLPPPDYPTSSSNPSGGNGTSGRGYTPGEAEREPADDGEKKRAIDQEERRDSYRQQQDIQPKETVESILSACINATVSSLPTGSATPSSGGADNNPLTNLLDQVNEIDDEEFNSLINSIRTRMNEICEVISSNCHQFFPLGSFIISLLNDTLTSNKFYGACTMFEECGICLSAIDALSAQSHIIGLLNRLSHFFIDSPFQRMFYVVKGIRSFCSSPESHANILTSIKSIVSRETFIRVLFCYFTSPNGTFSVADPRISQIVIPELTICLSMSAPSVRSCALELLGLIISQATETVAAMLPRILILASDSWWQVRSLACANAAFLLPYFLSRALKYNGSNPPISREEEEELNSMSDADKEAQIADCEVKITQCLDAIVKGLRDPLAECSGVVLNMLMQTLGDVIDLYPFFLPTSSLSQDVFSSTSVASTLSEAPTAGFLALREAIVECCMSLPLHLLKMIAFPSSSPLYMGDPPANVGGWVRCEGAILADLCLSAALAEQQEEQAADAQVLTPQYVAVIASCLAPAMEFVSSEREKRREAGETVDEESDALEIVYSRIANRLCLYVLNCLSDPETVEEGSRIVAAVCQFFPQCIQNYLQPSMDRIRDVFTSASSTDEHKQKLSELCHSLRNSPACADDANRLFSSFPPFLQKAISG